MNKISIVDKTIKVSVLEGDLAQLSALGFPLPLCIQLQLSCLKIDEAMWTAKSTPGGFSVNLFWPAPAPEKDARVQPKKTRKRKRRRAKASSLLTVSNTLSSDLPASEPSAGNQPKPIISKSCLQHSPDDECPVVDLTVCSDVNYEVREGVHGVTYRCEGDEEAKWTPVVAKKRKKKCAPVPLYLRRRFPPDHPIHQQNTTSNSDSDSGSDCDLSIVIPSKPANVQYNEVNGTPGLSIRTNKTRSWTPIATRTRSRLKQ